MKHQESLSKEQIQKIFDFTRQKYVKYYDVQIELVDHIAEEIQARRAQDPSLSFDDAMYQVYKSFGIFGFSKVQEEKVKQIEQYWGKRIGRHLLSYLTLPKLLMSIGLTIGFSLVTRFIHALHWDLSYAVLGAALAYIIWIIFTVRKIKSKTQKLHSNGQRLLSVDAFVAATTMTLPIGASLLNVVSFTSDSTLIINIILPIIFSLLTILTYCMIYDFPPMLEADIRQRYGHMDLSDRKITVA